MTEPSGHRAQGSIVGQHSQTFKQLMEAVQNLDIRVNSLAHKLQVVTALSSGPPAVAHPRPAAQPREPKRYSQELGLGRFFLLQCDVVFSMQASFFSTY